ncbi:hypothetical protein OE88DRAFT_1658812 [Heliocybe sulcata]|uniref:RING-type domain-containing protein n=1 Tax=Heliocybe sulcata TaxID=5364 RepID=A0A5C3N333_9AGAM|nr:hypothetical protein OE88DRAFT_1658812 [Heliocybe sulcata]
MSASQNHIRRPAANNRQRNPVAGLAASAGISRRRKSRSPDSRPTSAGNSGPSTEHSKKKKNMVFTLWPHSSPQVGTGDEMVVDRGRKGKPKHSKHHSRPENSGTSNGQRQATGQTKSTKRHRSASRDSHSKTVSPARSASATGTEDEGSGQPAYTGPLAAAEFARLKAENEALKKQLHAMKKAEKKQNKALEEGKQELTAAHKSKKELGQQMDKLKTKSRKSEELLSSIEANVQCQICLEYLLKPFVLSPCGHVYCQGCLQNWFKSAPPSEDDMYDDDYPDYLLYRSKSCPSCRTSVRARPIPLFVVKAISSAVAKSKLPPSQANRASPPPDADPWAGIFPTNEELDGDFDDDMEDDEDDEDEEDYDEDSDDGFGAFGGFGAGDMWDALPGYGTDSDDEPYEGAYVEPGWAPPTVSIDPEDFEDGLDEDALSLLRRGATFDMIHAYGMQYSHEHGIRAVVGNGNTVYLGWNILLHEDDQLGEVYMTWVEADILERPERWRVSNNRRSGTWTAYRLVPEEEVEEYDDTDSEAWIGSEDED